MKYEIDYAARESSTLVEEFVLKDLNEGIFVDDTGHACDYKYLIHMDSSFFILNRWITIVSYTGYEIIKLLNTLTHSMQTVTYTRPNVHSIKTSYLQAIVIILRQS